MTTTRVGRGCTSPLAAGPGEPMGIVPEVDGPRMRVRFDGDTEPKVSTLVRMSSSGSNCLEWSSERVQARFGLLQGQTTTAPPGWQVILDGKLVSHAH